jgi:hypothetical protein
MGASRQSYDGCKVLTLKCRESSIGPLRTHANEHTALALDVPTPHDPSSLEPSLDPTDLFAEDRDDASPQPCPPLGSLGAVDSEVLVSAIKS